MTGLKSRVRAQLISRRCRELKSIRRYGDTREVFGKTRLFGLSGPFKNLCLSPNMELQSPVAHPGKQAKTKRSPQAALFSAAAATNATHADVGPTLQRHASNLAARL